MTECAINRDSILADLEWLPCKLEVVLAEVEVAMAGHPDHLVEAVTAAVMATVIDMEGHPDQIDMAMIGMDAVHHHEDLLVMVMVSFKNSSEFGIVD